MTYIVTNVTKEIDEKENLRNMIQEYFDEMRKYAPEIKKNEDGIYLYKHFDSYFIQETRSAWFLKIKEEIIGFALVNEHTIIAKDWAKAIAEFYIKQKYRKAWAWSSFATMLFNRFKWEWEVKQLATNKKAQIFWKKVVAKYTDWDFTETTHDEGWKIQTFSSI